MFDWHQSKAQMRSLLNDCINSGKTADETSTLLKMYKANQCNACCINALAGGHGGTYCDKRVCFLDTALETYVRVAQEKCMKTEEKEVVEDD